MEYTYPEYIQIFKALADETRLKIVTLLSEGERCACQLLENFNITQPTLSYHMKILCECGIVVGRREGAWMYYQNNGKVIQEVARFLFEIEPQEASD
jgi:ArsR family transcriptional regulator